MSAGFHKVLDGEDFTLGPARLRCGRRLRRRDMILGLRTYRTSAKRRQPLIDFMVSALKRCGCRILFTSPASCAPFVITFETPGGERLGVVAYAFQATRTPTTNRPSDERSFQLKYGSKESYAGNNTHELWQDPMGLFTTLLVGIDPVDNFFVGADPEIHNPTKLFIRLEFKDKHAEEIRRRGWHAWERGKRGDGEGRREEDEEPGQPIEALVGGLPESFLRYVLFERAAHGLDQGNRQLLAEKPELVSPIDTATPVGVEVEAPAHELLRELGLSSDELLQEVQRSRRLKMAVRGWVAEEHLRRLLTATPGVSNCERLTGDRSTDIRLRFRDSPPIYVECKNVLRETSRDGLPRVDFQRTRASKADPCSRYYSATDFDVIAACLHAVHESWTFQFARTSTLAPHKKCPGKLASNLLVATSWASDPAEVLAVVAAARESSR